MGQANGPFKDVLSYLNMLNILMLTSFHWLETEVYDGYVHTNVGNMNPPLFLWKNKIFISEILFNIILLLLV